MNLLCTKECGEELTRANPFLPDKPRIVCPPLSEQECSEEAEQVHFEMRLRDYLHSLCKNPFALEKLINHAAKLANATPVHELNAKFQSGINRLSDDSLPLETLCATLIALSCALTSLGIPPSLRLKKRPADYGRSLVLLADFTWLQHLHVTGQLNLGRPRPQFLPARSDSQEKLLALALRTALYSGKQQRHKEIKRWGFIRPTKDDAYRAYERQLVMIPELYGHDDILEKLGRYQSQVACAVQSRSESYLQRYPQKHDLELVWQCATVTYGRIAEAARIYSAMCGTPITRQAMAKQLARLEPLLTPNLCLWKQANWGRIFPSKKAVSTNIRSD